MSVNLNKCVEGQKVRTRGGRIATYVGKSYDVVYPHFIRFDDWQTSEEYKDNGQYFHNAASGCGWDIVEILPMDYDRKQTLREMVEQLDMMKQKIVDMLAEI